MNIKGQGHSLTLVQGHSDSTFWNFFFLEIDEPIEASEILCGASTGWGNKSLFKCPWSHDQNGRHANK